jgi:hypothetical protein
VGRPPASRVFSGSVRRTRARFNPQRVSWLTMDVGSGELDRDLRC